MSTKSDLSDEINRILGLEKEIDFSKLSREDLQGLLDFFREPANLVSLGTKQLREKVRKEILDRPLRDFIEGGLGGLEGEDRGPLGLGILPSLMKRAQKKEEKTI